MTTPNALGSVHLGASPIVLADGGCIASSGRTSEHAAAHCRAGYAEAIAKLRCESIGNEHLERCARAWDIAEAGVKFTDPEQARVRREKGSEDNEWMRNRA